MLMFDTSVAKFIAARAWRLLKCFWKFEDTSEQTLEENLTIINANR
jgi:hypothetical protein